MSFSTTLKDSPANINPPSSQAETPRDRALKAFMSPNQAQQEAVKNPSSVSVEELSAVRAPTKPNNNGQSDSVEAPTSKAPAETKPVEEPLSAQFAALARREKAARAKAAQQAAELEAAKASIKAQEEALRAKEAEYTSKYVSKDSFQIDPLKALTDAGLSYDQITELLLNQTQAPTNPVYDRTIAELKSQIAELKSQSSDNKKLIEDRDVQARQQAVNQIQADVNKLVFTDPMFETIKATGQSKEVTRLIEETFDKEGVLMTVEEAAQAVEDYLVEEIYKAATQSEKIKKRLQSSSAPTAQKQPTTSSNNQLKTLTNSVGSTRQLSAKERAILAFKGEKF